MSIQTTEIYDLVQAQQQQFMAVLSDKNIKFEAEAGFAMQVIQNNDFLAKVAYGNKASMVSAITNIAAIGISLNPASKQAYLVPRKGKVCLDISYIGMMHLAQSAGAILWGQAAIVREQDTFELRGIDNAPDHKYNPFSKDRGEIIGVYVVVKLPNGDYLTHTMPIDAVYGIRNRSEAWKAYERDNSKVCPWVTDAEEMIKKTCVKQAQKYWPKSDRLDLAVHHLDTEGGEGIEFTPTGGADIAKEARGEVIDTEERTAIVTRLYEVAATKDLTALSKEWQENLTKQQRQMVGAAEWAKIKDAADPQEDKPDGTT